MAEGLESGEHLRRPARRVRIPGTSQISSLAVRVGSCDWLDTFLFLSNCFPSPVRLPKSLAGLAKTLFEGSAFNDSDKAALRASIRHRRAIARNNLLFLSVWRSEPEVLVREVKDHKSESSALNCGLTFVHLTAAFGTVHCFCSVQQLISVIFNIKFRKKSVPQIACFRPLFRSGLKVGQSNPVNPVRYVCRICRLESRDTMEGIHTNQRENIKSGQGESHLLCIRRRSAGRIPS